MPESARRGDPPRELLDPEGEGIYLLDFAWAGRPAEFFWPLGYAARLFHGSVSEWRELEHETVWMEPGEGDEWRPASTGRWPRYWRLNLPRRWRPVAYTYCTPKPVTLPPSRAKTDGPRHFLAGIAFGFVSGVAFAIGFVVPYL